MTNNTALKFNSSNKCKLIPFPQNQPQTSVKDSITKITAKINDDGYNGAGIEIKTSVDPFTLKEIEILQKYFLAADKNSPKYLRNLRNYLYIVLGVNLARRCGDMIKLRYGDIINSDGSFKTHLIIEKEQKTGKTSVTPINSAVKQAITLSLNYRGECNMSDLLFPNYDEPGKSMTVSGVRKMLQRACKKLELNDHIGTHSLRKVIASLAEDKHMVQQMLCHSKQEMTAHYTRRNEQDMIQFMEDNAIPALVE